MKIIGLGNALVDILVQLDSDDIVNILGFPKGSMQLIQAQDIPVITGQIKSLPSVMVSGGSAANTIHGLASLGTSSAYIGKVGKDDFGNFYAQDFDKAGVSCQLLSSETVTGRAYTLITPDTERTFATYLGAAIEMLASELKPEYFEGYDLLHVEGYLVQNTELIENALKLARGKGLKISLDLASFNVVEASLDFLKRIIPEYVDIVFANEEEARAYTGKEPEAALQDIGCQVEIAIVKIGKEGSLIQKDHKVSRIGIIPVNALDTTGAGDQYAAGFLHGLSKQLSLKKCGELGALMAGTVIQNYGARIPDRLLPETLEKANKIIDA